MTIEQVIDWMQKLGPGGIMAVMWYLERKERVRLQSIIESFLPVVEANARVNRALRRVVTGNGDTKDVGDLR